MYGKELLKGYFADYNFLQSNLESFNQLVDVELQNIIEENKEIEPTIIPHDVDEFKIRFDKIWIEKPQITEADGAKRDIFPIEGRLRKLTYSAPIYIEVSAHINGVQRESFTTQIGSLPIMLRSKYCHLSNLSRDELISKGEDPDDPGGYFIINGTEKVLINIEDLSANKFMVEKASTGISPFIGRLFSEKGSYKIPHLVEKLKDGIFYISFTRVKRIPIVILCKALGMMKDEDIMKSVSTTKHYDEVFVNLYEFIDIKTQIDAIDYIAKKIGIAQSKEVRVERMKEILDKYLLPHIGIEEENRNLKSINLCKMLRKFIQVSNGDIVQDDKDHYMNKTIKMGGDLLADLIRVNIKLLINDMLYNFQRIVKRGKFPSIKVIIREKLLTSRIYSSMATGNWVGGRKGISQRIQRMNFLDTMSHLQRVNSPLSTTQENFAARELHPTHLGRLCAIETPEGTPIGLKKNLALLCNISKSADEEATLKALYSMGLKPVGEQND